MNAPRSNRVFLPAVLFMAAHVGGCSCDYAPLHEAVRTNDLQEIERLLDKGGDIEIRGGEERYTPLVWAAHLSRTEAADLLIRQGADVTATDRSRHSGVGYGAGPRRRWTALEYAVSQNNNALAGILLKHGADVNHRAGGGWTPLFNAVYNRNVGMVRLLLEHGADAAARDENHNTPLHRLIGMTLHEVYYASAPGQRRDPQLVPGPTPAGARVEIALLLLEAGADPHAEDLRGESPWDMINSIPAQEMADTALLKSLFEKSAKRN
ncbi:MAG: ankyrin repeat domain-containing protein [Planctomycetes bacterium]|nr:ankyrin repeat domain-containing protein [Planctomycetota bacterium]